MPADQRHSCLAFVAVALPGKSYGVWTTGQHVQHMPGVWLAHRDHRSGPLGYVSQRDAAASTARAWLAEQDQAGTVSTITVDAAGDWAVFEDFGSAADLEAFRLAGARGDSRNTGDLSNPSS